MKKVLHSLAAIGLLIGTSITVAQSQTAAPQAEGHGDEGIHLAGEGETQHYPLLKPIEEKWSFAGPFGTYDRGQLQRGFKVYKEVCSQCHSLNLVAFRTLADLGYSEAQVKALAAEYDIPEGDDTRKGLPTDYFPAPAAQDPPVPDLSLMAKARGVTRGFPTFVFDIFTQYAEGGPDYIHSLLTGYGKTPPHGIEVAAGTHYNPYFMNASALAMASPLTADTAIEYDDGTPASVDQNARDVSAFLMWTAEPHLEARKKTGFAVMVFLVLFAGLVYMTKRRIWASTAH
ncbi:MAG: cytochrome c1 [Mesorhizobium sp.]